MWCGMLCLVEAFGGAVGDVVLYYMLLCVVLYSKLLCVVLYAICYIVWHCMHTALGYAVAFLCNDETK